MSGPEGRTERLQQTIALDASNFMLERHSGIKRYLAGLLPALGRLAPDLSFTAWMGYLRSVHGGARPQWPVPNIRNRALRLPRRLIERAWALGLLPAERIAPRAGVFHSFWVHLPPARRAQRVLTVFDIREVVLPEMYPEDSERVRRLLERNLAAADAIAASSRATAKDLQERFGLEGREIEVILGGVDEAFFRQPDDDVAAARRKFGIQGPYVIAMSSADPRKNIPWLIGAFLRYLQATRDDLRLVLAGALPPGGLTSMVWAGGESGGRFLPLGWIDDRDWRCLLSGADAFVYPSLYEGLGLPPLEAMACGTPVLAAEIPAVSEWAGDAALSFDPRDAGSFVGKLRELRSSPQVARRLLAEGEKRVKQYTWEEAARGYLRIYRRLLGIA